MENNFEIRPIKLYELQEALDLVRKVFDEFEAPEYCKEGIEEFKNYIDFEAMNQRVLSGEVRIYACIIECGITGILAMKKPCHISLLFVDKKYHNQGIATALFNYMLEDYKVNAQCREITVNSSPFAVKIYKKLGFKETDKEQTLNGIRFTPMKKDFSDIVF